MADLAAQQLLDGETEIDRLQTVLIDARDDLQRHGAALAKLQGELAASRLEVSGARGETVQFHGFFLRAEAQAAEAKAQAEELRAHAARLQAEIARLHDAAAALRAEVAALRASFSWRVTRPMRAASWRARGLRRRVGGLLRLAAEPAPDPALPSPPRPVDPNEPYLFKPAPAPDDGRGIVTLDGLYHLSRSL